MAEDKKEQSIIEIIQEMVARGDKEATIVQTLQDLGIEPEKAKRLLLLGQADTFAMLRGEISKIVVTEIEKEKVKIKDAINEMAEKTGKDVGDKVTEHVKKEVEEYQKSVLGETKAFQEQINDTVRKISELSDRVRTKLNELSEQVQQVRIDMDEMRISGVGARNRLISYGLIAGGLLFIGLTLFRFFTTWFQTSVSPESIIYTVIFAFVGMGFMFLATQV